MKLLKLTLLFIALVALQIATAQSPVEARMNAVFVGGGVPVAEVTNGVIGNTNITGGAQTVTEGAPYDKLYFSDFVTTTAGTISYAHIYISVSDQNENICVTIFNSSTGEPIASTAATTINVADGNWMNIALASSTTIADATTYWVGVNASATFSTAIGVYAVGQPETYRDDEMASYNCGVSSIANDTLQGNRPIAIILNNVATSP